MAIVKVYFRKSAEKVLRYVFNHSQPGDPVDSENCPPNADGAIAEFKAEREHHDFKEGNNEVLHIIQSWNEADSKKLTPQTINAMGRELIGEYFQNHQFAIVTHTETGKVHNHIVVSRVHLETGKLVESKFKHLHELRKINDRICLARGLEIPNQDAAAARARLPQKVQNMVRAGRESWVMDTKNKADVSRSLATSYNQYVDYLEAFGIKVRVEEKNITYFYPGKSRGKRGDKMGKPYDKSGLEKQFQENDLRFQAHPEIRNQLLGAHAHFTQSSMQQSQVSKDYGSYTKNPRRSPRSLPISEHELAHAIIPASEIRRAKRPISDYCKENNIGLTLDTNGHTVLRDKHYIVIQGEEAINTRNGTRGTLIDFVAAHHRLTLLQAVGKINGTTEPGLFEHHYGAIQRKYTPFYIPKPDQMPLTQATEHLSRFLKSHGGNAKMADDLLKHQRAEVSKTRAIRLFAENDPGGTLEFTEGPQNAWNEKKHGTFHRPFFQRPPKRNQMFLYLEPKAFLAGRGHAFNDRTHRDGILALMEPNKSQVDQYLKENPGVKKIQFVTPKHRSFTQPEIDFFGIMKHHLNPLGIECTTVSHERALSHEGLGLSI